MLLKFLLQILTIVSLVRSPWCACDTPHLNSTNENTIRSERHLTTSFLLRQRSSEESHLLLTTENHLSRRDDNIDDDLVVRRIQIVASTVPIVDAANALLVFYNSILYGALAPWTNLEPQVVLRMTMGCLELTMQVVFESSTTRRGIPWAFVRNFARNMLAMTTRGFTGTYIMYYSTDGGFSFNADLGIEVRLRILWGI